MSNPVVVVLHIPRTAGATLKKALRRTFGTSFQAIKAKAAEPLDRVAAKIDPASTIVQGHLNWGLHRRLDRPVRYATLLRNPVERTLSHYRLVNDMRAAGGRGPVALDDFLDAPIAGNLQAEMIAGVFELERLGEDELFKRAAENLAECWLVGRFDALGAYSVALGVGKLKPRNGRGRHPPLSQAQLSKIRARTAVDAELFELVQTTLARGPRSQRPVKSDPAGHPRPAP
jgi:hypothetical protein